MNTANLAQRLRSHFQAELTNTRLPDELRHRFDQADAFDAHVRKTTRRQVVTLGLSRFTAVAVIREAGQQEQAGRPVSPLQSLVAKGGRYGYDLIALVGWQTFVKGRTLQDVAEDLRPLNDSPLCRRGEEEKNHGPSSGGVAGR